MLGVFEDISNHKLKRKMAHDAKGQTKDYTIYHPFINRGMQSSGSLFLLQEHWDPLKVIHQPWLFWNIKTLIQNKNTKHLPL